MRVASLAGNEDEIVIAGDEAHYLARVVRVRVGERVTATDGHGGIATLEVIETGASVRARVLARGRQERTATLELWCGAPEGDRADWLIEKLGELGVATFVPVQCERARWERAEARRERWERLATAALRQSRSAWQLDVRAPVALADAVRGLAGTGARWVCRPDGAVWEGVRGPALLGGCIAAIGPSSGFSDGELNMLSDKGFVGVTLGRSRLRTETAAVAMAALWAAADNA